MSYLFVHRTYMDVDHMAPAAWKLLEEGEEVHAVITPGYDPEPDPRIAFLRRYPRFHVHELWKPRGRGGRAGGAVRAAAGLLRSTLPYAFAFTLRHRVQLVSVEWGYGFPAGFDRPRSLAGAVAVLRAFARSLVRIRDDYQPRMNFMISARLLGRPTVCLPHGLSIKLSRVFNERMAVDLADGPYDWRDRNRFSAYVLNTEHHRQWHVDNAMGDPAAMDTWGSLRWSPEWFEINRGLTPPFDWPDVDESKLKVVLMVPKWGNLVDGAAVVELVKRLQELDFVSLALKGHPRVAFGGPGPLQDDPDIDWERLHDVSRADSVPLIAAADAIIDIGSSIGIETVMQGRALINPSYLHEVTTLFDVIPGSCVRASNADEVADYLREHAGGSHHETPPEAYEELLRQAVYGSRPAAFDVVGLYCDRLRRLARADSDSNSLELESPQGGG